MPESDSYEDTDDEMFANDEDTQASSKHMPLKSNKIEPVMDSEHLTAYKTYNVLEGDILHNNENRLSAGGETDSSNKIDETITVRVKQESMSPIYTTEDRSSPRVVTATSQIEKRGKKKKNDIVDGNRQYFDTEEEYNAWMDKTEKEREMEIYDRIIKYEEKQTREKIAHQLKSKNRTDSDEQLKSPSNKKSRWEPEKKKQLPMRKAKVIERFSLIGQDDDVYERESQTSSESSSSDDDDTFEEGELRSEGYGNKEKFKIIDVLTLVEKKSDLLPARLTRSQIEKILYAPFFKSVIVGSYVMIRVGRMRDFPSEHIIAEVRDVLECSKQYSVGKKISNKTLKVRFGNFNGCFRMAFVSDKEWPDDIFQQYLSKSEEANVIPLVKTIQEKKKQIQNAMNHRFSDKDISLMIEEKKKYESIVVNKTAQKADLLMKLKFAEESKDVYNVFRYKEQLKEFEPEDLKEKQTMEQKSSSDLLSCIMSKKDEISFKAEQRRLCMRRVAVEEAEETPFTRKRLRPRVVAGSRSRPDLDDNNTSIADAKMDTMSTSHNRPVVDFFELYNSVPLNIDFHTLPSVKSEPPF